MACWWFKGGKIGGDNPTLPNPKTLPKITTPQNTTQHQHQQTPQNRIVIDNTLNKAI